MKSRIFKPPQGEVSTKDILDIIDSQKNVADGIAGLDSNALVNLANLPLIPASQLDFSFAWEKVAEISSSGVASVDITGLDGDTDKLYLLLVAAYNPSTTATGGLFIRYNADTTVGNYGWISWSNVAGTASTTYQGFGSTSGVAGTAVGGLPANNIGFYVAYIHAEGITAGATTYVPNSGMEFLSGPVTYGNEAGGWKKQANITEITLFTIAGVAIDWLVYLFKPKW